MAMTRKSYGSNVWNRQKHVSMKNMFALATLFCRIHSFQSFKGGTVSFKNVQVIG